MKMATHLLMLLVLLIGALAATPTWTMVEHDLQSTSRSEVVTSQKEWSQTWNQAPFDFTYTNYQLVLDRDVMYTVGLDNGQEKVKPEQQALLVINTEEPTNVKVYKFSSSSPKTPSSGNVQQLHSITVNPTLLLESGKKIVTGWQNKLDEEGRFRNSGICTIDVTNGNVDWAFIPSVATTKDFEVVDDIVVVGNNMTRQFVFKYTEGNARNYNLVAVKEGSSGQEMWKRSGRTDFFVKTIRMTPLTSNNSIVLIEPNDVQSQSKAHITKIDMTSGKSIWTTDMPHGLELSRYDTKITVGLGPTANMLFTSVQADSLIRYLLAFDVVSGKLLWTGQYPLSLRTYGANCGPLVVSADGKRLYSVCSERIRASTYNKNTVAFDATTGAKLWVSEQMPNLGRKLLLTQDDKLVVLISFGYLIIDGKTGKILQSVPSQFTYVADDLSALDSSGKLFTCGINYNGVNDERSYQCDKKLLK